MEVSGKKTDTDGNHTKSAAGINAQIYCEPCNKDGLRQTAHGYCQDCMEHLCETCYKTHRKPAPCRHHVLDKSQMPMSQSSSHFQVPHDLTKQCQLHKGKLIEYICHDHNILGCSPCVTINHRNCKIDYIPDVSKHYQTSEQYRQLLQSLAALQQRFKSIIAESKANKKKILENKSLVQDEIKKFRQEINDMFDNLETILLKEADDIFTKESKRIDSLSSMSIKLEREIEQLQDDISTLEKAGKGNALYIHSKENKDVVQKFTSAEKQACEDNYVNEFVFQPNMKLKEMLGSKVGIGELRRSLFETVKAKFHEEINVKVPSDKYDCSIPGAVVIKKDTVAVADSTNQAVKIVDTKLKKITSEKRFSSRLECLELLPNDVLAVTLTSDKTIVLLSISNGLSEIRRLVVDGQCRDLSYIKNKLIVAFKLPGKIQIMDLHGKVFETAQNDAYGKKFQLPYVACSEKNTIYIADWSAGTVTSMNLNGEILKSFGNKHLIQPCGMVILEDGSVLVCSNGNNSIFLISKNLDKGRVILEKKDGLLCPYSLALDKEQKKLYVGSGTYCNFLKVYNLK